MSWITVHFVLKTKTTAHTEMKARKRTGNSLSVGGDNDYIHCTSDRKPKSTRSRSRTKDDCTEKPSWHSINKSFWWLDG